jgi:hypothetical protein
VAALDERGCGTLASNETLLAIGKKLRDQNEDIPYEPLPRRWVDLIHRLDELERRHSERRQPEAKLHGRRSR